MTGRLSTNVMTPMLITTLTVRLNANPVSSSAEEKEILLTFSIS